MIPFVRLDVREVEQASTIETPFELPRKNNDNYVSTSWQMA